LLLPRWLWPISDPIDSIAAPRETNSSASRLRTSRERAASIFGSSLGPSAP